MPFLLGISLAAGFVGGFSSGGRLRNLGALQLRATPALVAGLLLGVAPFFADLARPLEHGLLVAANVLVAVFLVANAGGRPPLVRAGFLVLLLGWMLNMAPQLANGGMPLSVDAYRRSGQTDPITEGEGGFFKIVIADEGTRLRPLGDVIPVRPIRQVVSAGDIVLLAGISIVVAGGMRTPAATGSGGGSRDGPAAR